MSVMRPETLKRLGASVGTDDFLDASLALIAELIPHDMAWIVVYDRIARPQVLRCGLARQPSVDVDLELVRSTYEDGFYRFDPFFRHWRNGGKAGVIGMHDVFSIAESRNPYLADFMPITRMADDVALMLPSEGTDCVALTLERSSRYSDEEIARLREWYPFFDGLNETHTRIVGARTTQKGISNANAPLDFASAVSSFTSKGLTPRESEIVHLMLAGWPTRAISRRLGIGTGTVRNHRKRLYAKLDITTERELFSLFLGYLAHLDPSELM